MTNGVYPAKKKDGTKYYRAAVTYKQKHISLGSFRTEKAAGAAYALAGNILRGNEEYLPEDYERVVQGSDSRGRKAPGKTEAGQTGEGQTQAGQKRTVQTGYTLGFDKWIMLINLKKTGIYSNNPIYLYGKYFIYFLDRNTELKFDADEMFFYGKHRIQKRGGHLFYSDYGMQCSLLARYGVKSFSVKNRDYYFKNGDETDFRYGNLVVVNRFRGVYTKEAGGRKIYEVKIHFIGSLKVGTYTDETEAAIAYNKAADSLEEAVRRRQNPIKENGKSTDVENKMLGKTEAAGTNYAERKNIRKDLADDKRRINSLDERPNLFLDQNQKNGVKNEKNDLQNQKNFKKYRKWTRNFMDGVSKREYINIYETLEFSKSFKKYLMKM